EVRGIVTLEQMIESLKGLEIFEERDQSTNRRAVAKQRWRKALASCADIDISQDDTAKYEKSTVNWSVCYC
ncbi:hypothetical protein CWB57_18535, partial [Pseudoalteromonas sp. S186]